ncbi:MBL fold metallo-hydrolase [Halorarum halobium]|uniref:MBL fold metallo-hydrolase n=1 Tax=Halorarum halobium TaxID=3075121 RepID=UPI0028A6ABE3|nr:MBL fold metallo-hydrolase [Halobaculum sp. XH14]
MTRIDVLLQGIPGRSSQGYLGQASAALVDESTVVDVGSLARRPLLTDALDEVGVDPNDVEDVLLTHVHFDHCDNVDLFENATVHVYEEELARVRNGEYDWATPRNAAAMLDSLGVEPFALGDTVGGLEAFPTPGHTEHHVGFLLSQGDRTYGFTGDAVKNTREVATENPMVLHDKREAIETIRDVKSRVDLVIPGHDSPFYIEDGAPVPTVDVDFGVNLQTSPEAAVTADLSTSRSTLRELPEDVSLASSRQAFH